MSSSHALELARVARRLADLLARRPVHLRPAHPRGAFRRRFWGELRSGRGRHAAARDRLLAAVGVGDAPAALLARVRELDGLVAEADARVAKAEQDLAALDAPSDAQAMRDALVEFDAVWGELDADERARVLALVLHEVTVDGETGDAELRLRGGL